MSGGESATALMPAFIISLSVRSLNFLPKILETT